MKLTELKKKLNNKYVVRVVAGVLTIAMIGTGASAYTAYADKDGANEAKTVATASETEEKTITVSEKEIGKSETVYLISDATGKVTQTIVSDHLVNAEGKDTIKDKSNLSDITNVKGDETFTQNGDEITWNANGKDIFYQGTSSKEAPITQSVSYKLDGNTITPEELAGKSGRVTVRFDYKNNTSFTETVNGEKVTVKVPFAAITAIMLNERFSNVEVTNGKLESNGTGDMILGYALPGLKESLKVEAKDLKDIELPEYFEFSADVENFEMDNALTIVENAGDFASVKGGDLTDVDKMVNELSDASKQLEDGSKQLSEGLGTLKDSMGEFSTGVNKLKDGIKAYTDGATKIADGVAKVQEGSPALVEGVTVLGSSIETITKGILQLDGMLNAELTDEEIAAYHQAAAAAVDGKYANDEFVNEQLTTIKAMLQYKDAAHGDLTDSELVTAIKTSLQEQIIASLATSIEPATRNKMDAVMAQVEATTGKSRHDALAYIYENGLTGVPAQAIQEGVKTALGLPVAIPSYATLEGTVVATKVDANARQILAATKLAATTGAQEATISAIKMTKQKIADGIETPPAGQQYSLVTGAQALAEGTKTLQAKLPQLTTGINLLFDGSQELIKNNQTLNDGAATLSDGTGKIVDGVNQLSDGSVTLADGMVKFNDEGIEKLVNAYTGELKPFSNKLQGVIDAGADYQTYTDIADGVNGKVKFIYKLGAVKVAEK